MPAAARIDNQFLGGIVVSVPPASRWRLGPSFASKMLAARWPNVLPALRLLNESADLAPCFLIAPKSDCGQRLPEFQEAHPTVSECEVRPASAAQAAVPRLL